MTRPQRCRAAVHVRIGILPQMPVTAVGKIFKPTLRHRVIENVCGEALAKRGVTAKVSAIPDSARGTLVRIEIADTARKALAEEALARYTVFYAIA